MRFWAALPVFLATAFAQPESSSLDCASEAALASGSGHRGVIEYTNRTAQSVRVHVRNDLRQRLLVRTLAPGEHFTQQSTDGAPFVITDASGQCLDVLQAQPDSDSIGPSQTALAGASGTIIQTYAGADWTFQADGKPATSAPIGHASDVSTDSAGNIYIADELNFQAYKVTTDGVIHLLAGNGFDAPSPTGPVAVNVPLNRPHSIGVGPDGSVYVGESFTIRRIAPDGTSTRIAGGGGAAFSGDGGPATIAGLQAPQGIVFDSAGNAYFPDRTNNRVRKIDSRGIITTVAGSNQSGFAGDGGPAIGASLASPAGVRFDSAGNLYIADYGNNRIRKVDTKGNITTVAGGGNVATDNVLATQSFVAGPFAIDFDAVGNLYVVELNSSHVRKISPSGIISTIVGGPGGFGGDNGPSVSAQLSNPSGIKVDPSGNILIADSGNGRVRRINPSGIITTVAGNGLYRFSPNGTQALLTFLKAPSRVAASPAGLIYFTDSGDGTIRRVEKDGRVVTVATDGRDGITFDSQGNFYYVTNRGTVQRITPSGASTTFAGGGTQNPGNEGPATSAVLSNPSGLASDSAGNIYITDTARNDVRKVTRDGLIHLVAGNGSAAYADGPAAKASFNNPLGIAVDAAGNVYIADANNNRLRKVDTSGNVTTFAGTGQQFLPPVEGGPAATASLNNPTDLAFDGNGNLLVVDTFHFRLRSISPNGTINTIAGNGAIAFAGDGGPPLNASLNNPTGVAVDPAGNIYIADVSNFRIRVIPVAPPTLAVSPLSLSFTVRAGDAPPVPQQVTLTGSNAGLPYAISINGNFLSVNASSAVTPATVNITVNPGTLTPGNYSGTVTFNAGVVGVAPVSVTVNLTVQQALPSLLAIDTTGLTLSLNRGGSPASKLILVRDSGGGSVDFTVSAKTSSGGNWLTATPVKGTATPATPVALTVTANPAGLASGTYSGTVIIADDDGGTTIPVPVTLIVSGSGQVIRLSQTGLSFLGVVNGGSSPPQNVVVLNAGQGSFQFNAVARTAAGATGWLSVSPASGTSDSSKPFPFIAVSVNAAGLSAGDYYGRIEVTSPAADNSPQYVTVVLHVLPNGTDPGPLVQPSGLVFTGVAGAGDPPSQTLTVINLAASTVTFGSGVATLDGGKYIAYQPAFASLPTGSIQIVVQPSFAGLSPGVYRGAITLIFSDGSIQAVGILIVIAPPGTVIGSENGLAAPRAVGCTPTQLLPVITSLGTNFNVPASFPAALQTRVIDDCGSPATSGSVVSSFSNGDPPLPMISLGDGNWSATWVSRNNANRVSITGTADMPQPQLHGTVQVTGGLNGTPVTPLIGSGGIISASSFSIGTPLAPGSMISIFGSKLGNGTTSAPSLPLSTQLAGSTLVVAGQSMPLLFASDGQVNAILPFSTPMNTRMQVIATNGTQFSPPEEITVAAASPGVFSVDGSGRNQGHIYVAHADGTASLAGPSSPATAGDEVVIYCSGLGPVTVPVVDGAASPASPIAYAVAPPAVTVGGVNARVDFAGLTPGFVGLYQINAAIPSGVAKGDAVPLVITSVGQSSSPVTMAVK